MIELDINGYSVVDSYVQRNRDIVVSELKLREGYDPLELYKNATHIYDSNEISWILVDGKKRLIIGMWKGDGSSYSFSFMYKGNYAFLNIHEDGKKILLYVYMRTIYK